MTLLGRGETARLRDELSRALTSAQEARSDAGRWRSVIDGIPMGVVVADEQGTVVLHNAAAELGGHADVLLRDVIDRLVTRARSGESSDERLTLFGPPLRLLVVRAVPLSGGGSLVTIDDLSERARLDAVRTDFVSNISHELKTPVGALAILAETMAESDDADVNRRLAQKMVDEAHRAARTIDDLLELSRIELGGQGERVLVSAADVIGEAVARHRLTAESYGVQLELGVVDDVFVRGDRLQLVSAVSNLIDNAVKYSNRGGSVRISASQSDGQLELDVADQGVGIPARDIDRIFERFYRVDRARSRDTGGTGLGLAIVRHVATNHGGQVTVRSHEGEGSVFTLRIPMEDTP